jgi:hypothetical protein
MSQYAKQNLNGMRVSASFITLLALYLYLAPIRTQVYGSTESTTSTTPCDLLTNESCRQTSSTPDKPQTETENTQTPLIIPDISPTREDFNNDERDESTSIHSDNEEREENNDRESEESDSSLIPFP